MAGPFLEVYEGSESCSDILDLDEVPGLLSITSELDGVFVFDRFEQSGDNLVWVGGSRAVDVEDSRRDSLNFVLGGVDAHELFGVALLGSIERPWVEVFVLFGRPVEVAAVDDSGRGKDHFCSGSGGDLHHLVDVCEIVRLGTHGVGDGLLERPSPFEMVDHVESVCFSEEVCFGGAPIDLSCSWWEGSCVDPSDLVSLLHQRLNQVAANQSSPCCDQDLHFSFRLRLLVL